MISLMDSFLSTMDGKTETLKPKRYIVPTLPVNRLKSRYTKSKAVRELEAMANDAARIKYPNVPYLAPRKFRDDSANSLTNCVVTYIALKGGFASRINSTGSYRDGIGFTPGTQRKGIADVWATYVGLSLQIEVKHGNDRQSEVQRKVEAEQRRAGGHYYLAHDFLNFKTWFDQL
jgi:hypothetical protein